MPKSEEFKTEEKEINGVPIVITTYRIEDTFYCHIQNKDPGATIARAEADSREEATKIALEKTTARLK